jgi:hypothetical protein
VNLTTLTLLHANGIGWDEVAAVLAIGGLVALIAYWIDRGGDTDDAAEAPEKQAGSPGNGKPRADGRGVERP